MIDFLIFSDLHAHNFKYGAHAASLKGYSGFFNSRFVDSIKVLDDIRNYAVWNNIPVVVFCGDLFHTRSSVPANVRHIVIDKLLSFGDHDITLLMIPGNHDIGDKYGEIHHFSGLSEINNIHVFDKVSSFKVSSYTHIVNKINFVFVPYMGTKELTLEAFETAKNLKMFDCHNILIGHTGIQGATVGSDYVLVKNSDVSVSDIPSDDFDACFFGHFHEHQKVFKNGWYVGATHQHNWSDVDGSRGFLHAKADEDGVHFRQIETSAPKFFVVDDLNTDLSDIRKRDFVRFVTNDLFVDTDKVAESIGAHHVETVYSPSPEMGEFKLDPKKLTPSLAMEEWVNIKLPKGLDKEKVMNIGLDILKEVDQ